MRRRICRKRQVWLWLGRHHRSRQGSLDACAGASVSLCDDFARDHINRFRSALAWETRPTCMYFRVRSFSNFHHLCTFDGVTLCDSATVRQRQLLVILRSACLSTANYLDNTLPPAPSSPEPLEMRALRQVSPPHFSLSNPLISTRA